LEHQRPEVHSDPRNARHDGFRSEIDVHIDAIAERIAQIGGVMAGTVQAAASSSRLMPYPIDIQAEVVHLRELSNRYGDLSTSVRSGIDQTSAAADAATADILTGFSRSLEKSLWMLESHLDRN
jgi:starvation-inducible DNA-binding protein